MTEQDKKMSACKRCGSSGKYISVFGHYINGQKAGYFGGCWRCGSKTEVFQTSQQAREAWEIKNRES